MDCANCGFKRAKIDLKYLGKTVCNECFSKIIKQRISNTIKTNHLISKGDKICIALSGGKDSALVLDYLSNYGKYGSIELFALYVDRGDVYSKKSLEMVKKQAEKYKIPLHIASFKDVLGVNFKGVARIKDATSLNMCSICGVFRRQVINKKAKELGADKVVTGHNLTDEAQSYLMNMIRGDINSFAPLGPKSTPVRKGLVQRIRILRQIPENEVKKYVEINNIECLPNPCPHRNGSLRFNISSVIEDIRKFRPSAEFSICKVGDFVSEKSKSGGAKLKSCKVCGEPAVSSLCRACQYLELLKNKK